LNQISDSRSIVFTDWDQDGDLDLWVSNRTAPRLRFLQNNLTSENQFIAFRLQGTHCNRDAIGAGLQLHLKGDHPLVLTKTLKAGEGYLSQSSKRMHFGIPKNYSIEKIDVRWPCGVHQVFRELSTNQEYRIVEGGSELILVNPPVLRKALIASTAKLPDPKQQARVIPHARLPMPVMHYTNLNGDPKEIRPDKDHFLLLSLWAAWCAPCLTEMEDLEIHRESLADADLDVLFLNIEDLDQAVDFRVRKINRFIQRRKLDLAAGMVSIGLLEQLDVVQRILTNSQSALAVPFSFLLDPDGKLTAVYKGSISAEDLIRDVRTFRNSSKFHRDLAVPMAGRWFVNPLSPDVFAIPEKLLEISKPGSAVDYLDRHFRMEEPSPGFQDQGKVAALYSQCGLKLVAQNQPMSAIGALQSSLDLMPDSIENRLALALVFQSISQSSEAVVQYREILKQDSNSIPAQNSLAWLLASSSDPLVRRPNEAIRLAENTCRMTQNRSAELLDTLAVSYAAAGRFDEAVTTALTALKIARKNGNQKTVEFILVRLELYRNGQVFRSE